MISVKFPTLFLYKTLRLSLNCNRAAITNVNGTKEGYLFSYSSVNCSHTSARSSNTKIENTDENEESRMLKNWLETRRFEGKYVPHNITKQQFQKLLCAKTLRQRKNYISHLRRKERYVEQDKGKKENLKAQKKQQQEERLKINSACHIQYGLWKNSMFAKITKTTIFNLYSHRLVSAAIHGQPLVFDLGFEKHMNLIEKSILCHEVIESVHLNRKNSNPFNLILCNAEFESETVQNIINSLPKPFPMEISSRSYLELFSKEKLVYLSPDSRNEMAEFDPNAVYIIGGIVDHGSQDALTFAKADEEKIQTHRFPLDRYLSVKPNLVLRIKDITPILLELQETGNWKKAFKKIPKCLIDAVKDN